MKSKIYLLLIALLCTAATGRAATLLVKEYGVNNTYATIQAAINASVNNDTILVYTKPSGQLWLENITIDKNLWIANPIDSVRFTLQGTVTITPKAGMKLMMVGYNLVNGSGFVINTTGATATATNRASILISDAIVSGAIDFGVDWLDINIVSSIITGQTTFRHGIMAGNTCSGGIYVTQETSVGGGNNQDSIIIIGNKGTWCSVDTRGGMLISNNYFTANIGNNQWNNPGANILSIYNHSTANNVITTISNNTIINTHTSNQIAMALVVRYYSNTRIYNNIFASTACCGAAYAIHDAGGSTGTPFISHNIFQATNINANNINFNNELNYNNTGYGSIDGFGRASAGNTLCINKGLYPGQYYDIDLTRNDIGTYGGPFSIDNYITSSTGKGRVFWIDVPHQLSNINQLININAGAASKF
jgi:hypothetical protein